LLAPTRHARLVQLSPLPALEGLFNLVDRRLHMARLAAISTRARDRQLTRSRLRIWPLQYLH
jgi:hypothetical protein